MGRAKYVFGDITLEQYNSDSAMRMNEYLKQQTQNDREKMIESILEGICSKCLEVAPNGCYCCNDK